MITTEVTSEQIENWKKIYSENKNNLLRLPIPKMSFAP